MPIPIPSHQSPEMKLPNEYRLMIEVSASCSEEEIAALEPRYTQAIRGYRNQLMLKHLMEKNAKEAGRE